MFFKKNGEKKGGSRQNADADIEKIVYYETKIQEMQKLYNFLDHKVIKPTSIDVFDWCICENNSFQFNEYLGELVKTAITKYLEESINSKKTKINNLKLHLKTTILNDSLKEQQ